MNFLPDTQEMVVYQYTGDVSSLRQATESAIGMLNKYQSAITSIFRSESEWKRTLDSVASSVTHTRDTIGNMGRTVTAILEPLLSKFRNMGSAFVTLAQKLQSLQDKTSASFGRISQLANTVYAALRRTASAQSDADAAASRAASSHSKLHAVLTRLGAAFKRETKELASEKDELSSKNKTLNKSVSMHDALRNIVTRLGRNVNRESVSIRYFNNSLRSMSDMTGIVRAGLLGMTSVPLSYWLTEAVNQSISYIENLNLFTVAMGEAVEQSTAFVNQMAELYGMDPSNLMRYAGNFYQLADAIKMPGQAAANLALGLTKATNDIASLFNVDVETVYENLSSGIQGMSRAVRKYGMDIRSVTLQQTALNLGITENVDSMSEANRQGLRFITMMQQAQNASGDFARTINEPANQLRIFKEQVTQLGRAIGDWFVQPLGVAIQYINGFVMALRMVISFLGALFGVVSSTATVGSDAAESTADAISGIGSAAGGAAKKVKSLLAPFDELNVLSSSKDSGGGGALNDLGTLDPAIEAAIAEMQWSLEDIQMEAVKARNALLEFFGFKVDAGAIISWDPQAFENNLINRFPQWTKTIEATFREWGNIVSSFGRLFNAVGGVAEAVWTKVAGFFRSLVNDTSVSEFIGNLSGKLDKMSSFIESNTDQISNFAVAVGLLVLAFSKLGTIRTLIAPVATFVSTCVSAVSSFSTVLNWVGLVVATIAVLYTSSTDFAGAFNQLMGSVATGLSSVFSALLELLGGMWASIQRLWSSSIQSLFQRIGDALAPVIRTLTNLWEKFTTVVADTFNTVRSVWTKNLEPTLARFFDAIGVLAEAFGTLWSDWVDPVIVNIGEGLVNLWQSSIQPVVSSVVGIITSLIDIILILWTDVLGPMINWALSVLGPTFAAMFNSIADAVFGSVSWIGELIAGLAEVLHGVLDFIVGVFAVDWDRAWQGIVEIFSGIWSSMATVITGAINVVIGIINTDITALQGVLNSIIRIINSLSITVPSWVPNYGGKTIGFNLSEKSFNTIPYLASGGVVDSPTLAMIGEGKHSEAVIPLDNSPQMDDLVNKIAEASRGTPSDQPVHVQVVLDGSVLFESIVEQNKSAVIRTGKSPLRS